jgi:aspartate/methionine/tyrosine aminotransferase
MPAFPPATLNRDLLDTGTPPIPQAQGWARAYGGRFGPLIDLSQAVPGSPPPPALLAKLGEAAALGDSTRYGAITGDAGLREAYAAEIGAFYGAAFAPSEVAITSGCNQAYVVTMMSLARAGDNVLLPTPWYFNHEMTLTMLGVEPRPLPCDPAAGFVPEVADAEKLIDARTRAIVLVTPNNPTGAVYPPETIAAFAELCRRRGLWLVLDETYRDFLPAGAARSHEVFAASDWRETLIGLYSFSKAYAVPGWRLGAITASEAVIAQIGKVLDCVQISPVRAGQSAIAWGIDGIRAWREGNRTEINARAALFREIMAPLNGWRVLAAGAYFAYVAHPFAGVPAAEVVRKLVEERGVLALPGPYFGPGQERHLRIAIANVGADRIAGLGERLRGLEV